jgi:hypothetical protein
LRVVAITVGCKIDRDVQGKPGPVQRSRL